MSYLHMPTQIPEHRNVNKLAWFTPGWSSSVPFNRTTRHFLGKTELTQKGKVIHVQAWTSSEGFKGLRFPRFQDNRHMKVARLSASGTGHLNPQEIFLAFISVRAWVGRTQGHSARQKDYVNGKTPLTPSEIEPPTFRLAAQRLNQLRYRVPLCLKYINKIKYTRT